MTQDDGNIGSPNGNAQQRDDAYEERRDAKHAELGRNYGAGFGEEQTDREENAEIDMERGQHEEVVTPVDLIDKIDNAEPSIGVWRPQTESDGSQPTAESAVFQALGAASTCWENPGGAGVFDSVRAKRVGEGLLAWLEQRQAEAVEQLNDMDALAELYDEPVLATFRFGHLPRGPIRTSSAEFARLAVIICELAPRTPERTLALRKLWQSKNYAVYGVSTALRGTTDEDGGTVGAERKTEGSPETVDIIEFDTGKVVRSVCTEALDETVHASEQNGHPARFVDEEDPDPSLDAAVVITHHCGMDCDTDGSTHTGRHQCIYGDKAW